VLTRTNQLIFDLFFNTFIIQIEKNILLRLRDKYIAGIILTQGILI